MEGLNLEAIKMSPQGAPKYPARSVCIRSDRVTMSPVSLMAVQALQIATDYLLRVREWVTESIVSGLEQ